MLKLGMIVAMVAMMCGIGYSAPLGTEVTATIAYGDIPVLGSDSQEAKVSQELLIERPFNIDKFGGIKLVPYIESSAYNADAFDNLIAFTYGIGCEVQKNNFAFGIKRLVIDFNDAKDEVTHQYAYLKV